MTGDGARLQLQAIEHGWLPFRATVDRLGLDRFKHVSPAGWTVKEMLAHIAFWEETVTPVVVGWFRGGPDEAFEGWYGGEELGLTRDDPWPVADVHNAREAAGARRIAAATWRHYAEHLGELQADVGSADDQR